MYTILAVDDSPSTRQMVSFTLKNAGFDVVEAVDGQDAWEKVDQCAFDLVLTDQNMPRMDGIGLTKKLREHPKFKSTPILILTGESSDRMKQVGRAAGASGWLVKPFDPAKLIEIIGRVLGKSHQRASETPPLETIKFAVGDTFTWAFGSGVVLSEGKALLITGQGGRIGYTVTKGVIPPGAVPGKSTTFEIKFALEAVIVAMTL